MLTIKPTWVIFDVGGVIFDYESAFAEVASYLEVEKERISTKVASYRGDDERGGKLFDDILKETLKDIKKEHEYDKVYSLWWDVKKFLVGTKELVIDLQKARYKLAFLSNNWEGMGDKIIENVPEYGIVDMLFESSKEGYIKPEPQFYALVEEKIHITGDQIYFIDDVEKYVEGAKALGWQTFLYTLGNDKGETSNNLIRKDLLG